ncbi:hypothetical protein K474DRAFT_1638258, partial [Panus rudis PR-1116 ss-1]
MNEKSLHSALLPQSKASSSGLLSTPAFVVAIYAGQHLLRAGLSPHTLLQSVLAWGTVICGSQVLACDRDINLKSQTYSWAKLCTSAALQYVKLCLILFAMSQLSALRYEAFEVLDAGDADFIIKGHSVDASIQRRYTKWTGVLRSHRIASLPHLKLPPCRESVPSHLLRVSRYLCSLTFG